MEGLPAHNAAHIMASSERPAPPTRRPSLLPAFEPLSSSPGGLPRTMKRKFDEHDADDSMARKYYPTPVPTSSTGILPSSPGARITRPSLQRAVSTLSERAPLGAVPSIDLPLNGDPVLMGRSSNSSDYQLSANRLISRVHVRAAYHSPEGARVQGEVLVECLGWNGAKIHYQGAVVELAKGESFVSQKPGTQIMVDVQETRVLLVWPRSSTEELTKWQWAEESPSTQNTATAERIASSPPPMLPRLHSPESPSVNHDHTVDATFASTFLADELVDDEDDVQVYEDHDSADELPDMSTPVPISRGSPEESKVSTPSRTPKAVQISTASEPDELSEHDEENDPIVHSFGPFGDNILSRFESFQSSSPVQPRKPLRDPAKLTMSPRPAMPEPRRKHISPAKNAANTSPVKNHVINQLAFSRIHSIPLSTIYNNLPSTMKGPVISTFSTAELKDVMDKIPCVGEIRRQGTDAAGKPLEDEFYYVPELDTDEHRRAAVSIAKPPLRATRKQHKVCYIRLL